MAASVALSRPEAVVGRCSSCHARRPQAYTSVSGSVSACVLPLPKRWQPLRSVECKSRAGNMRMKQAPSSQSLHLSSARCLSHASLQKLRGAAGLTPSRGRLRHQPVVRAAIKIDRKRHLEESLRRQLEAEAQEEEDSGTCPVDCVTGVRNLAEFQKVLDTAEANDDLVVVDFYNAACGACKYVLPQFVKMCKSGGQGTGGMGGVVFVKHDVHDDYDDLTDLAKFYGIRMVPMFAFFQDGSRKEQFPTRDRRRVEVTIEALLNRRQLFRETYERHGEEPEGLEG